MSMLILDVRDLPHRLADLTQTTKTEKLHKPHHGGGSTAKLKRTLGGKHFDLIHALSGVDHAVKMGFLLKAA
jgi:hypothetical protein